MGFHVTSRNAGRSQIVGAGLFLIALFLLPVASFAAQAGPAVDYRDPSWIGSREFMWVIAQIHLLFGGFVLGVPIFAWVCELIGVWTKEPRYDRLAKEFTKLITACFEMTATIGIVLLFALRVLYPKVWSYLTGIFLPTYWVYLALFFAEGASIYLYYSKWDVLQGRKKSLHLFIGFLLNFFAFFIMIVPNSWASFQASPVVLSETMGRWERVWSAMNNPTWWPLNIHRLIANVVLGGFVCGAYAGIRFLVAGSDEERAHYDWMGYVGNFIGIFGLLPLPFAGYWLMMEIYRYNQQMGITLMGGALSWLFILQAVLIGVMFMGSNYYFWLGLAHRTDVGDRYKKIILTMLVLLLTCLGIWMTPHSMVASLQEARAMGGTHHPLLGVFGVMSAKMTVSNLMILITFANFLMYWRADKIETVSWAKGARMAQLGLIVCAGLYIVWAGVYGYFVPAIFRIYVLSVSQVGTVLGVILVVTTISLVSMRKARKASPMHWGKMPARGQFILVLNAVVVVLTMTLMGYARSGSRLYWHIYGVSEDTSVHAYLPTLGRAAILMSVCTFLFFCMVAFIFWVTTSTVRHKGFSTQYFFIAPFVLWLVSLSEKSGAAEPQVAGRFRHLANVIVMVCAFLIAFAYVGNQVPQSVTLPPTKEKLDLASLTSTQDLVKMGQSIFFGKGQCALCHSIGPSASARCPDLKGIGAKLTREFIYESLTQPKKYIYMDYTLSPPSPFPANMPEIHKAPIGLSEPEMLTVIAFLQSQGGEVTVQPAELAASLRASSGHEESVTGPFVARAEAKN